MKLDFLSPEQWTKVLALHSEMARRMAKGFLRCGNCETRKPLSASLVTEYLREGWPLCCPDTLKGGTMGYYANETNLKKEMARGD